MNSFVSIARIDMIEESKTFVFMRRKSTHTNEVVKLKMPVCVLVLLMKTKVLLSSIMSIQAILTKLFIKQI